MMVALAGVPVTETPVGAGGAASLDPFVPRVNTGPCTGAGVGGRLLVCAPIAGAPPMSVTATSVTATAARVNVHECECIIPPLGRGYNGRTGTSISVA